MHPLVGPHIERLSPYVPGKPIEELERELGISGAIKLASNENPAGPSPRALEAIARASADANRYPDASTFALRQALAAHHDVPMEHICVGNGSNELIDILCRTFATPAQHAVFGLPSFVCYALSCTAANVPYT
ncbi:MAG: aminotransferase class I/II-fold pyridoxal phosphate-dependent enzyme, partial [Myxococcales bacterium]|nr:aminotransferase class I/II-fold pyridoxal phosphate-dependent enzyme [Myxococcales bacterium]